MKYSSALVKSWNQPYFDKEPAMVHGFPNVLWGVVTESGASMFNVLPHSEVALIYEAGDWLFIGKTFSKKEIADAFTTGKFSIASSIDINDADYGTTRWVSKVTRYTFTSQF